MIEQQPNGKFSMRFLITVYFLLLSTTASAFFTAKQDFLPVEEAFQISLLESSAEQNTIYWQIAPGYYLYRHSIKATDAAGSSLELEIPDGIANEDEFFGQTEIYMHNLQVPVSARAGYPLEVSWQGCAEAGLCYPPQTSSLQINGSKAPGTGASRLAEDQGIAERLSSAGLAVNMGAFFLMGLLLAFTPCMLPMLPILSSVIAGSKPGGWEGARLGAAFVIAMALVYAALGVFAASVGSNLAAMLQTPWLLIPFATLFVLLALSQLGLFTLQLPAFIRDPLQRKDQQLKGGSMLGAAGLGVFSALLVGPCMTAPLAGALLYIGTSGDALTGGLSLFSLGIGSGLPLLVAMSLGMRWLPKPGAWMQAINKIFAYALFAAALFILRPLLNESLLMWLWGLLLLAIALEIGVTASQRFVFVKRLSGLVLGIHAAIIMLGAVAGGIDPLRPLSGFSMQPAAAIGTNHAAMRISDMALVEQQLQDARKAGQWVLLDFYADWCVSCKVMEKTVFGHPQVISAIADMRFIQPDVTENNKAQQALLKKHAIMGPPTILFIAPDGQEVRSARITGEVNAMQFLQQLEQARAGS